MTGIDVTEIVRLRELARQLERYGRTRTLNGVLARFLARWVREEADDAEHAVRNAACPHCRLVR
jgi:hypothetical protein